MRNKLIIAFALASACWMCSAKKVEKAKWEQARYANADSIYILDYHYNSNAKLFYMVCNDSDNIYVHIKIIEMDAQKKLLMNGFTVWVDNRAKGKKEVGVKYPLAPENKIQREEKRPGGLLQDFDKKRALLVASFTDLELINFPNEDEIVFVSQLDQYPVKGEISVNDAGIVHYTLKIPFENIGVDYEPGKLISLSMEGGEMRGGNSKGNAGGPSASMSGGRSGGMGGSHSGGGGGGRSGGGGGMQGGGSQMQGGGGPQSREAVNLPIKINIKHLQLL